MATPLSTPTFSDFDFLLKKQVFITFFQTKAEQEHTLTDDIHLSTYSMCAKFDILKCDVFFVSKGCVSV